MLCKYSLIVGNVSHELGDWCVKNWDEISYSISRIDYGGVTRSLTSKFEFYGNAYDVLWNEYYHNYLLSEAYVTVKTVDDNHCFVEKLRYKLDFSRLSFDGQLLTIYAFDNTLATLIKANKSTQYEYKVSELKERQPLYYDRLNMMSKIEWLMTGDTEEVDGESYITNTYQLGESATSEYVTVPIYIKSSEIAVKNIVEVQDVSMTNAGINGAISSFFFKNISDHGILVNLKGEFSLLVKKMTDKASASICVRHHYGSGVAHIPISVNGSSFDNWGILSDGENKVKIDAEKLHIYGNGGYLVLEISGKGKVKVSQKESQSSIELLTLDFIEKDKAVDIHVIRPITILNRLLRSINGNKEGVTGLIASGVDSRLDNALIIPAESARGIPNANLYTSYSKFEKWMNVMFGFVPIIGKDTVTFVHRDSNFTNEIGVEFEEVNEFQYEVNDNLIYSLVRVGYEKKDYDSVNGRDEFRWTTDFITGISINDNKLELISPYRADSYGIEFLAHKRGEDTTDNSSDSDVFFVCAELDVDKAKYLLVRSGYELSGVIDSESMFNAMYSNQSILHANRRFLGISISKLKFTSSLGNSDVVINGVCERDDFTIDKADRLFTVGEISFCSTIDTGGNDLPKIGKIIKDGVKYEAYLLESKRKYGRYDGTSYKMCVKSMS